MIMDIDRIQRMEKAIQDTKVTLKKEFIGIDGIIDSVLDNMRSWYLFPSTLRKPVVINLWGMTGCGKTSLVKRICELLDINANMLYYNLAKLEEDKSSELEDNISDNVRVTDHNPVLILDEFQYAATIDGDGHEKTNQTALKTIWELIDTGMLYSKLSKYRTSRVASIQIYTRMLEDAMATVKDGCALDADRLFKTDLGKSYEFAIRKCFKCLNNQDGEDENNKASQEKLSSDTEWSIEAETDIPDMPDKWLTSYTIAALYDIYACIEETPMHWLEFTQMLNEMDVSKLDKYIGELLHKGSKGYYKDYSSALIFVIGNIDEAYTVSYNMNPDMDADIFHEETKKMTAVDIKQALQKRFRTEQIARLGNTMLLYPSFSVQNFTDIITHYLDDTCERAKANFGLDLSYDDSIVDVIYKESVFPTQGARPILSGIYEIVETKIPKIMTIEIGKGNHEIKSIGLSYADNKITAKVLLGDDTLDEVIIHQPLRIDDERKNRKNETQAITAVHESGHFVMYAKLFGKVPKKLISNCVSSNANGFMMPTRDEEEFMSYNDYIRTIKVTLAGYVAEQTLFGIDNLTSGACADIEEATRLASDMLRKYGMGMSPCTYTYLQDQFSTNGGTHVNSDRDNATISDMIKKTINSCITGIEETFSDNDWRNMLLLSSDYLFKNTSMSQDMMKSMLSIVPKDKRCKDVRSETFYRDRLEKALSFVKEGIATNL